MDIWAVYTIAFSAVLLQAWSGRKRCRHWYLGGVIPLLYGGVIAWMFVGKDLLLALKILLYGTALPILLLLWVWWDDRAKDQEGNSESPKQ